MQGSFTISLPRCETIPSAQESPDPMHMVLTDVMMPRMTGPELVKRLESLFVPIKVSIRQAIRMKF